MFRRARLARRRPNRTDHEPRHSTGRAELPLSHTRGGAAAPPYQVHGPNSRQGSEVFPAHEPSGSANEGMLSAPWLKWVAGVVLLCGLLSGVLQGAEEVALRPKAVGPAVDNGRCFVCHLNYSEERFATNHAAKGVGCVKCHGESDAHCSDEDNLTAPEIMYPKARLNRACLECHVPEQIFAIKKHEEDAQAYYGNPLCTDCHKTHKLSRRSRHWDRATGQLLPVPDGPGAEEAAASGRTDAPAGRAGS
jgi:hypothetical protein